MERMEIPMDKRRMEIMESQKMLKMEERMLGKEKRMDEQKI